MHANAVWANDDYYNDASHTRRLIDILKYESMVNGIIDSNHIAQDKPPNSSLHWSRLFEYPWVINNLNLLPDDVVLDVGGSHSILQYYISKICKRVINIDLHFGVMLRVPKQNLVLANAQCIPLQSNSIDKCLCISTLEHAKDPVECVREIVRVLKPGGILTLTIDTTFDHVKHNVVDYNGVTDILDILDGRHPKKPLNILLNNDFGFPLEVLCIKYIKNI
jgi:SAM-dependent methyltransferase